MKPNWKTEDVQVAASITATVTIALTADLQIPQNLIRNLSLSQKLRTSSETENQQINFFLLLIISSTVSSILIFSVSTLNPFSFSLYSISVVTGAFK